MKVGEVASVYFLTRKRQPKRWCLYCTARQQISVPALSALCYLCVSPQLLLWDIQGAGPHPVHQGGGGTRCCRGTDTWPYSLASVISRLHQDTLHTSGDCINLSCCKDFICSVWTCSSGESTPVINTGWKALTMLTFIQLYENNKHAKSTNKKKSADHWRAFTAVQLQIHLTGLVLCKRIFYIQQCKYTLLQYCESRAI